MILPRFHKILAPLLLSMLLLVTSCATQAPSRWDQAQRESTQKAPISRTQAPAAGKAVTGGQFNKFFPSAGGGYQRVYTQEKQGFAEAKLKRGGTDVAVLSINDTASSPSAKLKFKQSSQTIAGYPAVSQGQNITSILVGDRYQVKVQSRDASFTQSDREAWLKKFNLGGLSRLR